MTREEFEGIENLSELLDFCRNYDCDIYDEIFDDDGYHDCIDEEINNMVQHDSWEQIRDYLDELPYGYDYYRQTEFDGWEGIDEYSDFDNIKNEVRDWAEEEEIFDEEDEQEDGQENDEPCSEVAECEEEEPEPDEPFTLSELVTVCKSSVQKIEDKYEKESEPDKVSDTEHVETCDPIVFAQVSSLY